MSDTFGRFTELSIIQYGIFNKKSKTKYQKLVGEIQYWPVIMTMTNEGKNLPLQNIYPPTSSI